MRAQVKDRLVIDGTNLGDRRWAGNVAAMSRPGAAPPLVMRWAGGEQAPPHLTRPASRADGGHPVGSPS